MEGTSSEVRQIQVQIAALLLTSYVTSAESLQLWTYFLKADMEVYCLAHGELEIIHVSYENGSCTDRGLQNAIRS